MCKTYFSCCCYAATTTNTITRMFQLRIRRSKAIIAPSISKNNNTKKNVRFNECVAVNEIPTHRNFTFEERVSVKSACPATTTTTTTTIARMLQLRIRRSKAIAIIAPSSISKNNNTKKNVRFNECVAVNEIPIHRNFTFEERVSVKPTSSATTTTTTTITRMFQLRIRRSKAIAIIAPSSISKNNNNNNNNTKVKNVVRFNNCITVNEIPTHHNLTFEERSSVWYTKKEYRSFREDKYASCRHQKRLLLSTTTKRKDNRWSTNACNSCDGSKNRFPLKPMRH